MAQQIRVLFALAQDPNSVPRIHKWLTVACNLVLGNPMPFSGLPPRAVHSCEQTHIQSYIIKIIKVPSKISLGVLRSGEMTQ